jgi:hypothetical protein
MSKEKQNENEHPYSIDVSMSSPKPNPMFSERQHVITKFLTYSKKVKCAHCGKAKLRLWTQLTFFRVVEESAFVAIPSKAEYPPLTPVCMSHLLLDSKNG